MCEFTAFDTRNVICADVRISVLEQARSEALRIHDAFDRFSEDSEVSRMLAACEDACPEFECSPDMFAVLQVSLALYGETGGAFNPAVGALVDLWRKLAPGSSAPSDAEVRDALHACDLSRLHISGASCARMPKGMHFDFGGIAKGYAAECVQTLLLQAGATRGFVNFGGTIAVVGPERPGSNWVFGLQKAGAVYGRDFWALLDASEGAFATSAGYFRNSPRGAQVRSHIFDPRTGRPVDNGVAEVTVHCQSATLADALSTALFVMGPEEGIRLVSDLGAKALFLMRDGGVRMSLDFPVRVLREGE